MLIVQNTVRLEDGSDESTWALSEEQVNYLLTYAINSLLSQGILQIADSKEEAEREQQNEILRSIPDDAFGKAN